MNILILIFILIHTICSIISRWYSTYNNMKPFYIMDAISGIGIIGLSTTLFLYQNGNFIILTYYILGFWKMITCGLGLWRLRRVK